MKKLSEEEKKNNQKNMLSLERNLLSYSLQMI